MKVPQHLNIAKAIEALEKGNSDAAWHLLRAIPTEMVVNDPAPRIVDCHATGVCVQSGLRAEQPAPVQQEPVKIGRITDNIKGMVLRQEVMLYTDDYLPIGTALYTSPPAQRTWVGLNEDQRQQVRSICDADIPAHVFHAIEAKLKEKNT